MDLNNSIGWHKFWFRLFLVAGIYLIVSAFFSKINGLPGAWWNLALGCLDLFLANFHRNKVLELEDKELEDAKKDKETK